MMNTALARGQAALILPEPCLMNVSEICAYQRHYAVRIAAHQTGAGHGLSDQERAHAAEVDEQYREWRAAVRWSYQRPDPYADLTGEDYAMAHPIAPWTEDERAAAAERIPF